VSNLVEFEIRLIMVIEHLSTKCNHSSQKKVLNKKNKLILRVKNFGTWLVTILEK